MHKIGQCRGTTGITIIDSEIWKGGRLEDVSRENIIKPARKEKLAFT
jgi:hypothetical protein